MFLYGKIQIRENQHSACFTQYNAQYSDNDEELFLWDGYPTNSRQPYVQKGPLSVNLIIVTSQHAKLAIDPTSLKLPSVVLPLHHDAIKRLYGVLSW